jgi:XTP/dITP diphosphohydrolase
MARVVSSDMKQVLFASSNPSKLAQFRYVAEAYGLKATIVSVYETFPEVKPYHEDYETQFDIVDGGIRDIYAQIKKPLIVEDSILEIDALGGRPGLHTADLLKDKGRLGLLEAMKGKAKRTARVTSMVGFYDGKLLMVFKTVVQGTIAKEERYKEGEPTWIGPSFHPLGGGFNSTFIITETGLTVAEHTAKEGLRYGYREPNFRALLHHIL